MKQPIHRRLEVDSVDRRHIEGSQCVGGGGGGGEAWPGVVE